MLLVSTRKGLFVVEGAGAAARVTRTAFVGDNVTLTLVDRRDGAWYAVLDHGHFGVKLHRSDDRGATWQEVAVPAYPPKPEGFVDKDMWGRDREWALKGSGPSRPRSTPTARCGRGPCPAACSARPIAARRGSCARRCGTSRRA